MRTPSSLLCLLLVVLLLADSGGATAASTAATAGHSAREKAAEAEFYHKVGNFAVVIYSLWHNNTPVPALERVMSADTRPARGNAVEYLLVLRVARLGTCEALVWGIRGEGSEDWKLKYFKTVAN